MTIAVTGGAGFLGSHVCEELTLRGLDHTVVRSSMYDLRRQDAVEAFYDEVSPRVVIHLAATCGGIGANRDHPGRYFYDNAIMGLNMIEGARLANIDQFVLVGTVCAYPVLCPVPFVEGDLWSGYPEPTNAPYGVAKKSLFTMLDAYSREYGLRSAVLIPTNLYGERDNFDPRSSHVIPAMIRRLKTATPGSRVAMWGTGAATRDFLHAADAARAIVSAVERGLGDPLPVNLGSGTEVSMRSLAARIAILCGYDTSLIDWDSSQPDGQPRRLLDTSRASRVLGWSPQVSLDEGLRRTVTWASENQPWHE
jgi:nucleoside-diphosphate-sugar epimerase